MIECERLWSFKDVAEYLDMSVAFVRKARDELKLPYIQLGAKVRFNPDTVREWAKGLEETADRSGVINWKDGVKATEFYNVDPPTYEFHSASPSRGITYDHAIVSKDGTHKIIDLKKYGTVVEPMGEDVTFSWDTSPY